MRLIVILIATFMWINLSWADTASYESSTAQLDQSFGVNGVVKIAIGAQKNYASGSAIQLDGKIVAAISPADADFKTRIALIRVNADGALDEKFGKNGVVNTPIGVNSRSERVAILPDGRIVVVGWAFVNQYINGIALVMYNPDGALDTHFADRGVLIFPTEYSASYVRSLTIQPDGKIVIGGKITIRKESWSVPNDFFFLARINENGTLDSGFGTRGVVKTDVGGGEITALAIQSDGKIVATGTGRKNSASRLVVVRYNQNGSIDSSFGNDGFFDKSIEQGRYNQAGLFVLPDGKIFVIGSHSMPYEGITLLAVRLHQDGSIDPSFGDGGAITMPTKSFLYGNFSPILQADGKIFIAANFLRPQKFDPPKPPFYFNFGVARFWADGQIDSSFGLNGVQAVSLGSETDRPTSLVVQKDGRVVVIGDSNNRDSHQAILIRFVP